MFQYSINASNAKRLPGAGFDAPAFNGVMERQRGTIGRMPFTLGSVAKLKRAGFARNTIAWRYLLHFNGTNGSQVFTDSTGRHTLLASSLSAPTLSTTSPKFGSASLHLPSTNPGNYIICPLFIEGDLLSTHWTIESWLKPESSTSNLGWLSYMYGSPNGASLSFDSSGNAVIGAEDASTLATLSMGSYSANVWTHRAVVRNGTTIKTYADGVEQDSYSIAINTNLFAGGVAKYVVIGVSPNLVSNFYGYIDEFRVMNGFAAYTSNFTPPSAPFPDP